MSFKKDNFGKIKALFVAGCKAQAGGVIMTHMFEGLGNLGWLNDRPWVLLLLVVWSLIWKGLALWRAARKSNRWWFIGLLVVNTLGILEILYLYYFSSSEENG